MKTKKELNKKFEQSRLKKKNAETFIKGLIGKINIFKETNKRYTDKLPNNPRSCKEIWETDLHQTFANYKSWSFGVWKKLKI